MDGWSTTWQNAPMANVHKHPVRGLRGVEAQLWREFEDATQRVGTDRSAELRRFMEWYVARPGAELPKRPEPAPGRHAPPDGPPVTSG